MAFTPIFVVVLRREIRNVRAVLVPTAIAWTAAVVLAAAWSLLSASPFVQRLGIVAIVLGALVMVGGSNAMSRGMEIESLAWAWGGKEDRAIEAPGLTTVGFAVLVGEPLWFSGSRSRPTERGLAPEKLLGPIQFLETPLSRSPCGAIC